MAFQPSSSIDTPSTVNPRGPYVFSKSTNQGISVLQGTHHVAQKLSTTTLPLKSFKGTARPEASCRVKSGAVLPGPSVRDSIIFRAKKCSIGAQSRYTPSAKHATTAALSTRRRVLEYIYFFEDFPATCTLCSDMSPS